MTAVVLVINAGSSSIKFAAFGERPQGAWPRLAHGEIEGIDASPRLRAWGLDGTLLEDIAVPLSQDPERVHDDAWDHVTDWLERHAREHHLVAVGHRVVHGGSRFVGPIRVTPQVLDELERLVPLAPLHEPHNLGPIRALARRQPQLPQVACFDTAFHASQPWVAQALALPRHISAQGVKRYGFHGLSYEYIASVLPQHLGEIADGRVVVAHLGNGASMCALQGRTSVASTMGFTALDGLMMGTRCGSIDPGVVLHLMQQAGMDAAHIEHMLYRESGLLGVSGISGDMRVLEVSDTPEARAAIDLFVYRIQCELGALAATMGGLDALVFTAGIGEHSALVRQRVCTAAAWLGIDVDAQANRQHATCITTPGSRASAWVIPTDEERMIAQHTRAVALQAAH